MNSIGSKPGTALEIARGEFTGIYETSPEFAYFRPLLEDVFASTSEKKISSTGYVPDTLHASIWSLVSTNTFHDCLLRAVNLGGDTDTTGCVAAGLAGAAYGISSVPPEWIDALPRRQEVEQLFRQFVDACGTASK